MGHFQKPTTVLGAGDIEMNKLIGRKWWKHFLSKGTKQN